MSKKSKALPDRIEEHARKLRPILDTFDRLDSIVPDNGPGQFKMPYTTRPSVPSREWKLTFDA